MWDARYAEPGFAYGTEPNDFLREVAGQIPEGPVLELCAGEGRNGVFLAGLGHDVTSVDGSAVGMRKAAELAASRGVALRTVTSDVGAFPIEPGAWAGIVSIFAHVPPELRRRLHARVVSGLRLGGVFVLEAYTPAQVGRGTGGPPDPAMCMTAAGLREELQGLEIVSLVEKDRDVVEGKYHKGGASVVQLVARKAG